MNKAVAPARQEDGSVAAFLPSVVVDWLRDEPQVRHKRIDGALVFVDISGFTAMSERLATLGREGAERVTEIIDNSFTQLLGDAGSLGGSLLKFGGDALLLLFAGEDATARAAAAAWEMRATLKRIGTIKTPAGVVKLQMSVGVHAGEVDLFLVGSSHRELFVAGPAASEVVRTEGRAGSANVLLSEAARVLLASSAVDDAGQLVKRPRTPNRIAPEPNADGPLQWRALSTALRRHLQDPGRDRAEHRQALVAFVHFSDFDRRVGEPDVAGAELHQMLSVVQSAVDRRGLCLISTDVDVDGGKLVVAAGVPIAHADDADRMLLAMHEITRADLSIPISVGVHIGPLFAGEIGPTWRKTYTVMGDVVNTAARTMSRAPAASVFVTDEALAATTVPFSAAPVPPFLVKGKSEPLRASELQGIEVDDADLGTVERPVIGRDAAVRDLLHVVDSSAESGTSVGLVGDRGVGKTALVQTVAQSRAERPLIVLRAHAATAEVPYGPVISAFRQALGLDASASREEFAHRLVDVLEPLGLDDGGRSLRIALGAQSGSIEDVDPASQVAAASRAVDAILTTAFRGGLLLVVENAQWLDAPSRELLGWLIGRAPSRDWCILSTSTAEGSLPVDRTLVVQPLDETNATELALVASEYTLLPPAAREVARRAGGNPLFVIELVDLIRRSDASFEELPPTLEAALAARIDELDPTWRSRLREIAVLGSETSVMEVLTFLDLPQGDDGTLSPLAEFLEESSGIVRFRQSLISDAAYGGLSFQRRRDLHLRAGEMIERTAPDPELRASELVRHFDLADDATRAWRYGLVAAEQARQRAATTLAAECYERALRHSRRVRDLRSGERGAVHQGLGAAQTLAANFEAAAEALKRAARDAPDDLARTTLAFRRGVLARDMGKPSVAIRNFNQAIRLSSDGSQVLSGANAEWNARAHLGVATIRMSQGRLAEAQSSIDTAMSLASAIGSDTLLPTTWMWQCWIRERRGEDGEEFALKALSRFQEIGHLRFVASARNALAVRSMDKGRWTDAIEHFEAALRATIDLGVAVDSALIENNLAGLLYDQGKLSDAARLCRSSARVLASVGHSARAAPAILDRCIDVRRGERAPDVEDLLQELVANGLESFADQFRLILAEALADTMRLEEASLQIGRADERRAVKLHVRRRLEARLAFAESDPRALLLATEAVERSVAASDPYAEALAVLARARFRSKELDGAAKRAWRVLASLGVERGVFFGFD